MIKTATVNDLDVVKQIIKKSILDLNGDFYSKEQLNVLSQPNDKLLKNMLDKTYTRTFLIEKSNEYIGFGSVNVNYGIISGLYIISKHTKSGYGTKLLNHMEEKCISKNLNGLIVYSSVESKNFYSKNGYNKLDTVSHNMKNVDIPMTVMKKEFNKDYEIPEVTKEHLSENYI